MDIDVLYRSANALARVRLDPAEELRVEGGAMVAMSGLTIETRASGGIFRSLKRIVGGESFFLNLYKAGREGGELYLAPAMPGDMRVLTLDHSDVLVQSGAFVAGGSGVEIDTTWSGARRFFAGHSLIMLRARGTGDLLVSSYGALHELELGPGETYTVDTGHLVTMSASLAFSIKRVGGLRSTVLSGEGLVVELTGPGRATLQSRSEQAFLGWLIPQLPDNDDRP
ncbi:MAG: TIGR00266 family protein [Nitriliruptorales bacterium]|nr:TIGR00266 family protein [Nitriliruptorales bacterium]